VSPSHKVAAFIVLTLPIACSCASQGKVDMSPPVVPKTTVAECSNAPCYCANDRDCPTTMSCNPVGTPGSPNVCGPK